jgi:hypothetical protein
MKQLYLMIICAILGTSLSAQQLSSSLLDETDNTLGAPSLHLNDLITEIPALPASITTPLASPIYSGASSSGTIYTSTEVGLLLTNSTIKGGGTGKGSGSSVRIEIGYKFIFPSRRANLYHFFSMGLGVAILNTSEKYTGTVRESSNRYDLHYISVPVSYMMLQEGYKIGYYFIGGVIGNINYNQEKEVGAPINAFKNITVEPQISGGISFKYEKFDNIITCMLGPYVGYVVTNTVRDEGSNMSLMTVGLKFTAIKL